MSTCLSTRLQSRGQRGFTMVEILVAVLILSIGLLGLAALQTTGLRSNHSAYLRSQANALSYDMMDRMRATRRSPGFPAGYAVAYGGTAAGADVAANDVNAWLATVASELPAGEGQITTVAAGLNTIVTISVRWDDSRGEEALQVWETRARM